MVKHIAILSAALILLISEPPQAGQILPKVQAANPIFEHAQSKTHGLFCGRRYGAKISRGGGFQQAIANPIVAVGQELAQLFRPIFKQAATHQAHSYSTGIGHARRQEMPSELVNAVGRQKMCS